MNGAKIMEMTVSESDIRLIDTASTFNMVAMAERDTWDRTFWMGVLNIHAPPTSFTDAFTTGAPSAFLETRSIQSAV